MTVSVHQYEPGFYPGTGAVNDIGFGLGRGYSINLPLRSGASDSTFVRVVTTVIGEVRERYKPDAVVCQCGADGLSGDPLGAWNLTPDAFVQCVRLVHSWALPLLLLGGGGYAAANAARCWTAVTAALLGQELEEDIPEHHFLMMYGPGYELNLEPGFRRDLNNAAYIDNLLQVRNRRKPARSPPPPVRVPRDSKLTFKLTGPASPSAVKGCNAAKARSIAMPRAANSATAKQDVVSSDKTYVPSVSRPMRETRLDDRGSECDRRLDKNFTDVNAVTKPPAGALKVGQNAGTCDASARERQVSSCAQIQASDRQRALDDFRSGKVSILIATDLESRALDVEYLTHVFNYDYPLNIGKYLYRVQRAGRAGRGGFSVTLVTRQERMQARDLIDVLEEANQYVTQAIHIGVHMAIPWRTYCPTNMYAMADHFDAWKKRCAKETSTDCRRKDSSDDDQCRE
ncbi:hypothetical protein HPB49_015749 [Dermacentor silvarum]|uniref:Uncharacterized protein n=1 Tax=Dermacentor silvarum TaxID=543639 RepID=A0ACB8E1C1_DERSI|nr:hypothetical protein HPB49_015749 [Dermacentor silvarum]